MRLKSIDILSTFILLFSFLIISCSEKDQTRTEGVPTFKLNTKASTTALKTIAHDVEMIRLETMSDQLIGIVRSVQSWKDYLYMSDGSKIFKYNKSGEFILSFGTKGQGPGEYSILTSFVINSEEERIVVTSFNKIITYDMDGNYLVEKKYANMLDAVVAIGEGTGVLKSIFGLPSSQQDKSINATVLSRLDQSLTAIDSTLIRAPHVTKGSASTLGFGIDFTSTVNDSTFIYYPVVYKEPLVRDTLYAIIKDKLVPTVKVDFGIKNSTEEKFLITSMNRSKNYLLVNFMHDSKNYQSLIDIRKGTFNTVKDGFIDDFKNTGNSKLRLLDGQFDQFYFIKEAPAVYEKLNGVSEYDNPIIFIVNLH